MAHGALMHEEADDVAVVITDVTVGSEVRVVTLEGKEMGAVEAVEDIPLGHKIAIRPKKADEDLIKYGRRIGKTTKGIAKGAHVHTQNVRSIRWETSVSDE